MKVTKTLPLPFRLFQSDFIQKVSAALGSRALTIALGFVTSIFIARHLGPEGRGLFGIATTFTALGVQLGLLGFHSANTFYVAKNPSLLPTLISNSLVISGIIGGGMIPLLLIFQHKIIGENTLPLSVLYIALAIIPLSICFSLFQGLLTGIQKFKLYNYSEILNKGLNTFLILTYVLAGNLSLINAITVQAIALTICIGMMFICLAKLQGISRPALALMKKSFSYGGRACLACFFAWGVIRSDVFMLKHFQTLEQVGYFSVALSLIEILLMFSSVIGAILHPKLCKETDLVAKWILTKKTLLGSSIILLLGSIVASLWDAPILWMFGKGFAPCHTVIVHLLPGFILLSIETILVQFTISISFPWRLVFVWAIALGMKLLISLQLIPLLGIQGVGISWTISYLFVLICVVLGIRSELRSK